MTAMLEMRGVSKSFAGVQALRDVNFTVESGQIHALVGENGAGKSTLMKVLSGVYPHGSYEGSIIFDGEERRFRDINDSEALGIIIIHQELALIPLMSIAENIFLSHPPARFGVIDRNAVYRRTQELLAQVGLRESPDTLVTDLGVGKQQLVEIAKALSKRVRLLILDEPTASLNEADSAALLDRLIEFRRQGMASILISHKLNEVARVADRITVLRDGRTVDSIDCRTEPVQEDRIIRSMVDRDLAHRFPERDARIGEPVLVFTEYRDTLLHVRDVVARLRLLLARFGGTQVNARIFSRRPGDASQFGNRCERFLRLPATYLRVGLAQSVIQIVLVEGAQGKVVSRRLVPFGRKLIEAALDQTAIFCRNNASNAPMNPKIIAMLNCKT